MSCRLPCLHDALHKHLSCVSLWKVCMFRIITLIHFILITINIYSESWWQTGRWYCVFAFCMCCLQSPIPLYVARYFIQWFICNQLREFATLQFVNMKYNLFISKVFYDSATLQVFIVKIMFKILENKSFKKDFCNHIPSGYKNTHPICVCYHCPSHCMHSIDALFTPQKDLVGCVRCIKW